MKVMLNDVNKIKDFVAIARNCVEDIDICSGRYVIDAKSIMGIFTLDTTKPITLKFHADEKRTAELEEMFKDFKA